VRRIVLPAASSLALVAAAVACGADARSAFEGAPSSDAGPSSGADSGDFGPPVVGAASGVVILHAAAFPSFRLCFENYPELAPQPDTALMPAANVVGVEVGSVIRIGALESPPGKVYVIDQREVRATPGDPLERKCGALMGDRSFGVNHKYQVAGEITTPLGVENVDVLAITGCGGGAWLNELGISSSDCSDWDPTAGSLRARTVPLLPTNAATDTSLPVQVVHMAPLLESTRDPNTAIEVTFGAIAPNGGLPLGQRVASSPPLFEAGAPTTLAVDQTDEAFFGSRGFRIALRSTALEGDGEPVATFFVDQSLAEVQALSSPLTVPTTYYRTASNYALLLLGDPRIERTYTDGGANPTYDARRAVHLLAVPVKEASDAGPNGGEDGGPTE
jgi:hypothetical protein